MSMACIVSFKFLCDGECWDFSVLLKIGVEYPKVILIFRCIQSWYLWLVDLMFIPRSRFCVQEPLCMHKSAAGKFLLANPLPLASNGKAYDHSFRYCLSPFLSLLKSLVTSREERISFHLKNNHFCLIVKKQVVITNVCVYKSVRVSLCLYHNFKNTLFHGNWWKV